MRPLVVLKAKLKQLQAASVETGIGALRKRISRGEIKVKRQSFGCARGDMQQMVMKHLR